MRLGYVLAPVGSSYPASLSALAASSISRLTAKRCCCRLKSFERFCRGSARLPSPPNNYSQLARRFSHPGMRSRMERSRLTLFWGLMLGLSSCLRPAAAESKYRRCTPPLPGQALPPRLQQSAHTRSVSWPSNSLYLFFFLNPKSVALKQCCLES